MPQRLDLTGQRFGRLTVVGPVGAARGKRAWRCVCDCGREIAVPAGSLRSGNTRSCGCLASDILRDRNTIHGGKRSRLYGIWVRMRQRCSDPNSSDFARYGGRGIRVCAEWDGFEAFRDWALTNGYRDDLTIDRIDNDGRYEPGNCRWMEHGAQARNKRSNHLVSYRGETRSLAEWAESLGIAANTLKMRLRAGWPVERALTAPVRGAANNGS